MIFQVPLLSVAAANDLD